MKHYYLVGEREVDVREEPTPEPGNEEVLIELAYTTLSPGSNLHSYQTSGSDDPSELLYMGSGTVREVGSSVDRFSPGDRVAAVPVGHQEYTVLPESEPQLVRVPDGVSLKQASISYLSAWSVSALHLGRYAAAENVVVVGPGLVGASAVLVADVMGARVIMLDTDPARVEFSQTLGVGPAVQPDTDGADERISDFLGDRGADIIIEATGSWSGFRQAIELARDYTRIPIMGIYREPPPPEMTADLYEALFGYPSKFHYQRLQIVGCGSDPDEVVAPSPRLATRRRNYDYVLEQAARGKLALDALITHCLPAEDIKDAMERMADGETEMVGVVFDWNHADRSTGS